MYLPEWTTPLAGDRGSTAPAAAFACGGAGLSIIQRVTNTPPDVRFTRTSAMANIYAPVMRALVVAIVASLIGAAVSVDAQTPTAADCTASRPMPGHENTVSVTTAPPSSEPN